MYFTINENSFYFGLKILYLHLKWTGYIYFRTPRHKRLRLSGFVLGLWILSIFGWRLASVLRSCWFWFRYLDDIVDLDLLYLGDIDQFVKSKKLILENLHDKEKLAKLKLETVDLLIIDVYYSCLKHGQDNQQSMLMLFEALEYDLYRVKIKKMYYTQAEIREYFNKLDIPSVMMTFQFIKETAITVFDLEALIDATRARYNLRDFIEDLKNRIVNISLEEIESYNIDMEKIINARSLEEALVYPQFKSWFKDQLIYIEERLAKGREVIKSKPIRFRTYLALMFSFIKPCEKSLKQWRLLV